MKYYKLIDADKIIGVCSSYDLRKHQIKHDILLASDEDSAQYIQFKDKLYRDEWFKRLSTEKFDYDFVRIVVIDEEEYNILLAALETEEEVIDIQEENKEQETVVPPVDQNTEITIAYVKNAKVSEMSSICNRVITNGFDVLLSDGGKHHFSLTVQDQLNLITLSSLIAGGETTIPYHADGELCRYYSVADINSIVGAATSFKTYHVTYFNSLKAYIESLDSIEDIGKIEYGVTIPEEYQSDILKELISHMEEE